MRPRLGFPIALLLAAAALPAASAATPESSTRIPLRDVPLDRSQTREVHTPTSFDLVGFSWRGPAPDEVEVRTRGSGGWSEWTELEATAGGSEPLWTGPADTAQVRATRGGADATADLELIVINPGARPAPDADTRIDGSPPVVSRAQWGADEGLMTWAPEPTRTRAVVVHHTAGTNDYDCAQSADIVRAIYRYHAVELQWGDIGYHALVDKCGTVFEGRAGGLRGDVVGGHARGFNQETFGVSMLGNYDRVTPSSKAVESVAEISAWKLGTAGVRADGRTELVAGPANNSHHPAGAVVALPTIFGHRDVSKTICPGQRGYEKLGLIRARAAVLQRHALP
ncbi:peptidoglycan recognition protein [Saccharopolyspora sp. NPDC000359]|uniref:peptidoglycan recognition protein family protein n=1 Tax=Saccharopolyspora sp. NPDC000359 TaxID=3154251 RepID=UPI00332ABD60